MGSERQGYIGLSKKFAKAKALTSNRNSRSQLRTQDPSSQKMYTLSDLDQMYDVAKRNLRNAQRTQNRYVADQMELQRQRAENYSPHRVEPKTQREQFVQVSDRDYQREFPTIQL